MAFLVVAVVLISGCTGSGGEAKVIGGTGLEITDFTVQPAEIRGGSKATFAVTVENQGDELVDYKKAVFSLILPSDWTPAMSMKNLSKSLKPADPSMGSEGDIVSERFTSDSPKFPRGQTRTDDVTGRVYYDYQTKANGVIYIYPYGEDIDDTYSFESDNGPVRIDVRSSPDAPIVENVDEYFTLIMDVTNLGSGKLYKPGITKGDAIPRLKADDYDRVELSFDIMGDVLEHNASVTKGNVRNFTILDSDCRGGDDSNINKTPEQQHYFYEYELYGSPETTTIMCDIEINHTLIKTKTPISIEVVAKYGYYTEEKGSVEIVGRD